MGTGVCVGGGSGVAVDVSVLVGTGVAVGSGIAVAEGVGVNVAALKVVVMSVIVGVGLGALSGPGSLEQPRDSMNTAVKNTGTCQARSLASRVLAGQSHLNGTDVGEGGSVSSLSVRSI